jgi:hypothetical protein
MNMVHVDNRSILYMDEKENEAYLASRKVPDPNKKYEEHKILFPGITVGYNSIEQSKNHIKGAIQSKQKEIKKVVFEVHEAPVYIINYCKKLRKATHRLVVTVQSYQA